MKLLHIPPRLVDDITLLEEHSFTAELLREEASDTPEAELYADFLPFVFLRHEMIESELLRRGVAFPTEDVIDVIPDGDSDFPFDFESIAEDVEEILEHWEEWLDVVEDGDLIEELCLLSAEEIYEELDWLYSLYREEYEL